MANLSELFNYERIVVKDGKCVEYGVVNEDGVYERDDETGEIIFGGEDLSKRGLSDGVWRVVSEWDMEECGLGFDDVDVEYVDERGGWEGYVKLKE